MISIITINYNNAEGLQKTYESLAKQKNKNFEWVIIDGNSNDGSIQLINNFEICKNVISEPDNGIYDAMNKGILNSKNEYILFLNSGDIFSLDNSISILYDAIREYSKYDLFMFGFRYKKLERYPRPNFWRFWSLQTSHQAILYKNTILAKFKYDDSFKYAGDFEHMLRIYKHAKLKKIYHILIENEEYGCDDHIGEVLDEYSKIVNKYLFFPLNIVVNYLKKKYNNYIHG